MEKEFNHFRELRFKSRWVDSSLFQTDAFIERQRIKRERRKILQRKVRDIVYQQLPREWNHHKKLIVSGRTASLSLRSKLKYEIERIQRLEVREYESELHLRLSKMLDASELLLENFREMPAILLELFDKDKDLTGLKAEDVYYTLEVLSDLLKYSQYKNKSDSHKLPQGNKPTLKGLHDLIVGDFLRSCELGRLQIAQILVSLRSSLTKADILVGYHGLETVSDSKLELNATYQRLRNAGI